MNKNKLKVLSDYVLISGIKPETRNGVVVGVSVDDKPEWGTVIASGPGRVLENGTVFSLGLKAGMKVLFNQHVSTEFNLDGELVYLVRAEDIVAYEEKENQGTCGIKTQEV